MNTALLFMLSLMNDKHHLWLVHLFFFFLHHWHILNHTLNTCEMLAITSTRSQGEDLATPLELQNTHFSELFRKIWRRIGQLPQLKHMDHFFTMGKVACGFLWTVGRRIGKVSSQEIEFHPSVWKLPDTGLSTEVTTHCAMPGHLRHLTDTYLLKEYFLNCEQVLVSVFPFINLKMLSIADNLSSL